MGNRAVYKAKVFKTAFINGTKKGYVWLGMPRIKIFRSDEYRIITRVMYGSGVVALGGAY